MLFAQGGSLSLYVWLSIYVCFSLYLSVYMSVFLFVCLSLSDCLYLTVYLFVRVYAYTISIYLSDCPSISVYPSSCLSPAYLFISVSVSLFLYVYLPVSLPTCLAYIHLFIHAFINFYSSLFIHTFIYSIINFHLFIHIHFFSFIEQWVSSKSLSSSDVIVRPVLPYSLVDVLNLLNLALKFFRWDLPWSGPLPF